MKKLVCVFWVILMLFAATVGNAETVDVTVMTADELIDLISKAQAELILRIGNAGNDGIDRGIYVVGEDIKAGQYLFTCVESYIDSDGNPSNYIDVRQLKDDGALGKELYSRMCVAPGSQVALTLEEGTAFRIDSCSGYLTKTDLTPSWAP